LQAGFACRLEWCFAHICREKTREGPQGKEKTREGPQGIGPDSKIDMSRSPANVNGGGFLLFN